MGSCSSNSSAEPVSREEEPQSNRFSVSSHAASVINMHHADEQPGAQYFVGEEHNLDAWMQEGANVEETADHKEATSHESFSHFEKPKRRKTILKPFFQRHHQTQLADVLKQSMKGTQGRTALKEIVKQPPGEDAGGDATGYDMREWIALNTVHHYNAVNLIWESCIQDECSARLATCKRMNAGPKFEYLWQDSKKKEFKRPTQLSAPIYISELLKWFLSLLNDQTLFVVADEDVFPDHFMSVVKGMYRRLFRFYGHCYHAHFGHIKETGSLVHFNTCFLHLYYFIKEFELCTDAEMKSLAPVIKAMSRKK